MRDTIIDNLLLLFAILEHFIRLNIAAKTKIDPITVRFDSEIVPETSRCTTTAQNLAKSGEAARDLLLHARKPTGASKVRRSTAQLLHDGTDGTQ